MSNMTLKVLKRGGIIMSDRTSKILKKGGIRMSDRTSKKAVCLMLTAVMLSAASTTAVYAENVSVTADNLSVTEGSVTADLIYNTDTTDGYVMAAVYDEEQRCKSVTSQKVNDGKTLSITMSPTDTVKTFIWKDLSETLTPLADVVGYDKKGLYGTQKTEWTFEDGTGVAAVHDYSTENDPTEWTFGTARWDNGQTFYESAYPVIKNVSEATAATMPDFANWLVDSNYANRGGTDYAAPGSSKCMEFTVNSGQWGQNIAAIRVLLSKNQLQPGKKYKISMYTKNSVGTRAIYSTLKAPWTPYYNSSDNYFNDSTKTANIPWAHYTSASPVAYSNCYWTPYEFVVEPKDEDFNSAGYTNLWLAYTREFNADQMSPGGVQSSSGISYSMDKFWIDDFKITEYDEHPLEWNFENASDDIGKGSELGKWVSATSTNTGNSATSGMLPIEQSGLISGNESTTSTGAAPNSTKCLKLSTDDQWCEKIGVKVKVSKDQLVPGKKYKMSMYTLTALPDSSNIWSSIYATLQPTTTTSTLGLYYEKNGSIIPGVFTGRNDSGNATGRQAGFGVIRPYWYKLETTLTPQESDFDRNGYAYLWLTCTHSDFKSEEGKDKKLAQYEDIYLDDISITEVTATN